MTSFKHHPSRSVLYSQFLSHVTFPLSNPRQLPLVIAPLWFQYSLDINGRISGNVSRCVALQRIYIFFLFFYFCRTLNIPRSHTPSVRSPPWSVPYNISASNSDSSSQDPMAAGACRTCNTRGEPCVILPLSISPAHLLPTAHP